MTDLRDAIRDNKPLAIHLVLPGPPDDMTITDVIGELYIGEGAIGWVSTSACDPMPSGHTLHVRRGRFESHEDGPPWRFVVDEGEAGTRIASIFEVEHGSIFSPAVNDWHAVFNAANGWPRDRVRRRYAELIERDLNVSFAPELTEASP